MSESQDMTPRTGMRPWLKVLLAVSLTLNLAVIGAIVGAKASGHDKDRRHGPPRVERSAVDPALGPFARSLPDDARKRAMENLRSEAGEYRLNREQVAKQLGEMITLLKADEFDAPAFRALMDAQRVAFETRGQVGRDVVMQEIEAMSADERAAMADKLERGFRRAMDRAKP